MSLTRFRAFIAAGAATAALLAGCGLAGPHYPTFGQTAYRIEGLAATPEGATRPTVIYRDGPNLRVETTVANNAHAVIVFDQATNAAYMLTPTGQQTMPSASAPIAGQAPALPPPAATTTTTTTTGTTATGATATTVAPAPTALGVAVRIANEDAPQPLEASWEALGAANARSDGDCTVAGVKGHEWRPRESSSGVERTACITDDGVVLRLREGDSVLFEATRLERGPQEASLFGIPQGYQIIDPAAVAEQVGDTMQHLDSVTGAPQTTPSPAPATPSNRPPG